MVSTDSYLRMSSGYARLSRPAICSDEQPSARCVLTYCHSQESRSLHGHRDGPEPTPGCTRGSRCWEHAPISTPSSAANGRGPGPDSRSHGLQHSSVCSIVLPWQHPSPSGPVVLHLGLELKKYIKQTSNETLKASVKLDIIAFYCGLTPCYSFIDSPISFC